MKTDGRLFVAALCVAALAAGCDRSERGPVKSVSQQPAPSQGARTDVGQLPSQQSPRPGAGTDSRTPVQGQADAREGGQRQHFDKNS